MPVNTLKKPLTVEEFEELGKSGIYHEDDRVELIEGEIIEMTPIGRTHAGCVLFLNQFFTQHLGNQVFVNVQNPLVLGDYSEPQPDIVLLKPREDYYRGKLPEPDDVLLVVEVADSSLQFDQKRKVPLYAKHEIPELWIVNLAERCLEVYRQPNEDEYGERFQADSGQTITPLAIPELICPVSEVLG